MEGEEIERLIKEVDVNGNDEINYTGNIYKSNYLEFMVAALDRQKMLTTKRIDACFHMIDSV